MNLCTPNANDATLSFNRSKSVVPMSGLCSRCIDGCRGNCEIFRATFRGREVIYPGPFGQVTAGADKDYPVDYFLALWRGGKGRVVKGGISTVEVVVAG